MKREDLVSAIDFEINSIRDAESKAGPIVWITSSAAIGWTLINTIIDKEISITSVIKVFIFSILFINLINLLKMKIQNFFSEKFAARENDLRSPRQIFKLARGLFFFYVFCAAICFYAAMHVYSDDSDKLISRVPAICFAVEALIFSLVIIASYFDMPISFSNNFIIKKSKYISEEVNEAINGLLKFASILSPIVSIIQFCFLGVAVYYCFGKADESISDNRLFYITVILITSLVVSVSKYLNTLAGYPLLEDLQNLRRGIILQKISFNHAFETFHKLILGSKPEDFIANDIGALIRFIDDSVILLKQQDKNFELIKQIKFVERTIEKEYGKLIVNRTIAEGFSQKTILSLEGDFAKLTAKKDSIDTLICELKESVKEKFL